MASPRRLKEDTLLPPYLISKKKIEPSECKVNVIVCREGSLFFFANNDVLYPIVKLIIHRSEASRTGSVMFAVDTRGHHEALYSTSFEYLYTRDGSDYIFVDSRFFFGLRPPAMDRFQQQDRQAVQFARTRWIPLVDKRYRVRYRKRRPRRRYYQVL